MRETLARARVYVVERPLDPDLEITRYIGDWIRRRGNYPTFLFQNPLGHPGFPVVMNLLKRSLLLASLGVGEGDYLRVLNGRLVEPGLRPQRSTSLATRALGGLDGLPILRHQPREPARYLTSFITCLQDPDDGSFNTGFYRTMIKDARTAVVFMDPRTHAHAIVRKRWQRRAEVPVTMFCGASPAHYFVAASNVPPELDSYEAACRVQGRSLPLDDGGGYPPAPADAEVVIRGRILEELEPEGPFGEFKGYYCQPTRSPIMKVDSVTCRPDARYLGLFCGKESGLTLMALPNEILMFQRLRERGIEVEQVRYPLAGLGEFVTLVKCPRPSQRIAEAVLELDRRTKTVIVSDELEDLPRHLAAFSFDATTSPYIKRNERHGDRVALVVRRTPFDSVEY
jgi:2,5-furandicarboxylate decarboxylase 1